MARLCDLPSIQCCTTGQRGPQDSVEGDLYQQGGQGPGGVVAVLHPVVGMDDLMAKTRLEQLFLAALTHIVTERGVFFYTSNHGRYTSRWLAGGCYFINLLVFSEKEMDPLQPIATHWNPLEPLEAYEIHGFFPREKVISNLHRAMVKSAALPARHAAAIWK